MSERSRLVAFAGLPTGQNAVEAWIKCDMLIRRVVGRRLELRRAGD
jgi:hypothetical protein